MYMKKVNNPRQQMEFTPQFSLITIDSGKLKLLPRAALCVCA
jgi:hypothetical protein